VSPRPATTGIVDRETPPTTVLLRWRFVVRATWIALATLALGLFFAGVPVAYLRYRTLCEGAKCDLWQLSAEGAKVLEGLGVSIDLYAAYYVTLGIVFALGFWVIGVMLFWKRSDDRLVLLASMAFVMFGAVQPDFLDALADTYPSLDFPVAVVSFVSGASFFVMFCLFPDGRFAPRWTRATAAVWIAYELLYSFFPDTSFGPGNWPRLIDISLELSLVGSLVLAQTYRYARLSGPVERQQTKWVVFGFTAAIVAFVGVVLIGWIFALTQSATSRLFYELVGATVISLSALLIPLSIGVAILRYRLWDIDIIINRTLVYAALTVSIVVLYASVVSGLGTLLRTGDNFVTSLLATGVVAVLFAPLRVRLQRGVNRLMYGERDDPYAVLSRMGKRLETTFAPKAVMPIIVETVAQALKLPYVAISLKQDGRLIEAAHYGEEKPAVEPLVVPLTYQKEAVGELVLFPRTPGEPFGRSDLRLLEDLARQVGVAAHALRLTADLQRSRERLVTTREEERRRLRRDLHDGVGPQLAALTLKIEAARNRLSHDPQVDALLSDLAERTRAAVDDVRGAVNALRPPSLDELGLIPALREGAAQYAQNGLGISVEAPESLPVLPAAVEVAVYRIAQEAMTNVVRHAKASNCWVRIALDEDDDLLRLEIEDDGRGMGEEWRAAGVGLHSMRERAEELGGACTVESLSQGGSRVSAQLPCQLPDKVKHPREE
jgi:signal transduction histidine kinase